VTITAISTADSSKTAAVSATIQFSNASLSGPYVFSFSGYDPSAPYYVASRFVADGDGNIVSFDQDFRQGGLSQQMSSTGTYTVQPDGRGTLTLSFEGMSEPSVAMFQMTSLGEGPVLQFVSSTTGSGQFYKQDSGTFSNASMKGPYVLQVLGAESSGTTVAGVGVISCDGAGNCTGIEDINTGKNLMTKLPVAVSYSVDANGRTILTATVAGETETTQLAMYFISNDHAVGVPLSSGSGGGISVLEKQQITTFSNASLSGDYVFYSMADPATEGNFILGRETLDGAGTITGVSDHNAEGALASQNQSFAGTYSVPPSDHGRGTSDLGAIFYIVSEKKALMISTDSAKAGQIVAQQGVPFSTNSLQGTFAFSMRGFDALGGEIGVLGSASVDGSGNYASSEAVNHAGILTANETLTGTYSVSQNGRGQLVITVDGNQFLHTLYVVDSSHAFVMEMDTSGTALFGSMEAQF